jgi:hypothetical protein
MPAPTVADNCVDANGYAALVGAKGYAMLVGVNGYVGRAMWGDSCFVGARGALFIDPERLMHPVLRLVVQQPEENWKKIGSTGFPKVNCFHR